MYNIKQFTILYYVYQSLSDFWNIHHYSNANSTMTMSSVSLTISTSRYSVSGKFIQLQNLHTVDVSLS